MNVTKEAPPSATLCQRATAVTYRCPRAQRTVQGSFGDAHRALTRAGPLTTEHHSPLHKTPLSLAQHSPVPYSSAHL